MQERQETGVLSLGQEDALEDKWQSTPVFLLGKFHGQKKIPWTEEPHGLQSVGSQRVGHN